MTALAASSSEGAHALLAELVGTWHGRARLWVEPGVLHCEDEVGGEITALHGGRWVMHRYATRIDNVEESGTALIGAVLGRDVWQMAWVDTWHTGTEILLSEGDVDKGLSAIAVTTSYAAETGPPWKWRTEFEPGGDALAVRHFNINPQGDEAIAVEFAYLRA